MFDLDEAAHGYQRQPDASREGGKAKNLAVFAEASHKRVTERVAEHPARPFMLIDASGQLTQSALTVVIGVFDDALK